MATRKSFKPSDTPQVVIMNGPLAGNDGKQRTWVDDKNPNFVKTFYLFTLSDNFQNESTLFAEEHVKNMLNEKVPNGASFSIWRYGRLNPKTGKYFGDVGIKIGSEECLAEKWDNPQGTNTSTATNQQQQQAQQQQTTPMQQQQRSVPDDIGISVECFTYAARVFLSTPVQAAYAKMGLSLTSEDLRALAISFMIDRRYAKETEPRSPRYLYENLTYFAPGEEPVDPPAEDIKEEEDDKLDDQAGPGAEIEEEMTEDNPGGYPEDDDLPF